MSRYFKLTALAVVAVFLVPILLAMPPTSAHDGVSVDVETCEQFDFTSPLKTHYMQGEQVIVRGKTENKSTTLDIYLVADIDWVNGQTIPARVPGTLTTVTTDSNGLIQPIVIWASAQPGKYDIFVDTNNNGVYNPVKDALWDNQVTTEGFFVAPEYGFGALLALSACFAALVVIKRKQ
jgi:hypothetical protein